MLEIKEGMKVKGLINGAVLEIIEINNKNKVVIYKDCKSNKTFVYGLEAFKRCALQILD